MTHLARRPWVPAVAEERVQAIAADVSGLDPSRSAARLLELVERNRRIHEQECVNLNPAANVMNPRAEALLSAGLGTRPSLGYPGMKYETGLEAIEEIEVMAAEFAAEIFKARYAEVRVASGAAANLYMYMACAKPGDLVFAPPAVVGGHVTHHASGAAGLYGVRAHPMPVDASRYSVDVERVREDARRLRPKVISIGGSLNLFAHPVRELRAIADEIGAILFYDAAHVSGLIAGGTWQQPLAEGAHAITMSTYKSLGGPPGGLIVTSDESIARRLDAIAYPGMTANFDVAKTAALAMGLLDWKVHGNAYAKTMVETASALAHALVARDVPVFAAERGCTQSHAFAVMPRGGDGGAAAVMLRGANLLASSIGVPVDGDNAAGAGLRLGVPEMVRWGMGPGDAEELATYLADALLGRRAEHDIAADVSAFRRRFGKVRFVL